MFAQEETTEIEDRNSRAHGGSIKQTSNYLRIPLHGQDMNAIVDKGFDVNLVPVSLVNEQMIRQTDKMTAINQTPVKILGE